MILYTSYLNESVESIVILYSLAVLDMEELWPESLPPVPPKPPLKSRKIVLIVLKYFCSSTIHPLLSSAGTSAAVVLMWTFLPLLPLPPPIFSLMMSSFTTAKDTNIA